MKKLIWLALLSSTPLVACGSCDHKEEASNPAANTTEYYSNLVTDNGSAYFQVPGDWKLTPPEQLDNHVVIHATGSGKNEMPPTLNLAVEETDSSLEQYLEVVKEINSAEGHEWKEIGEIETASGKASLSQCDRDTQWGTTRLLHAILVKDKKAYTLTASSLQDEFADNYELFFESLKSLHVPSSESEEG